MKRLLIALALFPLMGDREPDSRQTLVLSNLEKIKGRLYIGWYRSKEEFRKPGKAVLQKVVEVDGKESVDIDFNVPPGVYAVAIFLDENGNGKMDTNMLGIPKEKYGFSNNKYPLTRAASFEEASFRVGNGDQSHSIRLKG